MARPIAIWGLLGVVACTAEPPLDRPSAGAPAGNSPRASTVATSAPGAAALASGSPPSDEARRPPIPERPIDAEVATRLERSLGERLIHSVDGLDRRTIPGVGEVVDTRGRFQHVVIQTRNAAGRSRTECVENQAELMRALIRVPEKGAAQ